MPIRRMLVVALLTALTPAAVSAEPLRYSGSLIDAGVPAEGEYALRMTLYDAPRGGRRIGKEITRVDVAVSNGGFATDLDFGMPLLSLERLWLQVEVAGSDGRFESLGARETLDPKMMKAGVCWSTTGNAGTSGANFLGTLDLQALELRVNNARAMRIVPTAGTPNFISGLSTNSTSSVVGATIAGGGRSGGFPNSVADDYGTVGGGAGNSAGTFGGPSTTDERYGTVAGGDFNGVLAAHGTIGGGVSNLVLGDRATVPGGAFNLAGGTNSFAAGYNARVRAEAAVLGTPGSGTAGGDAGTFAWSDSTGSEFASTGPRQFLVRASNGVGINGTPQHPDAELSVYGVADDAFGGNVELRLIPTLDLNDDAYESIELGVGKGGSGTNDATFRVTQRNGSGGYADVLTIASNGVTSVVNGAVGTVSDARLKKNIQGIDRPLDTLLALHGHVYEYLDPAKAMHAPGPRMGFIAQEVQQALPNWVTPRDDGYLQVSTIGFEALAVEAMRELAAENAELQAANDALTQRLARIETWLARGGR